MRTCRQCGERKKLTAFAKDKKAPSGRRHVCRVCQRKTTHFDRMETLETRSEDLQ